MKDKKLLELIDELVFGNGSEALYNYILKNDIDKHDLKLCALALANYKMFDYIDCRQFTDIIENLDNEEFMDNETNFY